MEEKSRFEHCVMENYNCSQDENVSTSNFLYICATVTATMYGVGRTLYCV